MKIGYFVFISVVIILFIIHAVKKSHLSIKESFFWIAGSCLTLVLCIFPGIINATANFLGVSYPPTVLFVACILFILYLIFRNTKLIAFQQEKIVDLAQQVAILKNEINELKKDKK